MAIYESCIETYGQNALDVVQCVAKWVENEKNSTSATNDAIGNNNHISVSQTDITNWLLVLTGALVFFMQAGFAMVCAGAIRKKNVNNTMLKNLLDACGAGLAFYAFGFALAYGDDPSSVQSTTFLGTRNFFLSGDVDPAIFFFQYTFSATCVTIIAGTLAERCRMASYFAYSLFLTGIVYPIVVHSIWSGKGFLSTSNANALIGIGMVDFAGSGVVHMTGGSTALYATYILGPRQGRFYDRHGNELSKPGLVKGQSVALQLLGTFILFFGWFGFNPGSALLLNIDNKGAVAALAAVNTTLSAATATISALFTFAWIQRYRNGEFQLDLVYAMNGCLSGLVAITSGCAVVETWAAVLIGIVAGWIYIAADYILIRCKLDDAVAAIQVHLGSGMLGVIATGLLASPRRMLAAYGTDEVSGFFYSPSSSLLPAQLTGIVFIMMWTLCTTVPFFTLLDYLDLFRVNALEEIVGLDMSYLHQEAVPNENEEPSDDEEVRLAAYRQRFAERKNLRLLREQQMASNIARRTNSMSHVHVSTSGHDSFYRGDGMLEQRRCESALESYVRSSNKRDIDDDNQSKQGSLYSA